MTLLIGISDFTPYKSISHNINVTKKLEPYIVEAQEFDLKDLLGQELYNDLLNDFIASPPLGNYEDLYNGSSYTKGGKVYTHKGLIPVLVYFTYARFIMDSNSESTAFGQVVKTNQYSEPLSEKAIDRKYNQAKSGALAYWKDVEKFLNDNSIDYPLWKNNCKTVKGIRITDIG